MQPMQVLDSESEQSGNAMGCALAVTQLEGCQAWKAISLFLQPVSKPVSKTEAPVCSRSQGMDAGKVTVLICPRQMLLTPTGVRGLCSSHLGRRL